MAGNPEIIRALERSISKIQRLEISQFTSINGRKSVEQHQQIIEACKNKDKETTAHLVEQNWLSLEKLMTYEED